MLPALVLSIVIRTEFWQLTEKQGKQNGSLCCPSQNEHINIKKAANSHIRVISKNAENAITFLLLPLLPFLHFYHIFCPGNFSGTTTDTSIININLEPGWVFL